MNVHVCCPRRALCGDNAVLCKWTHSRTFDCKGPKVEFYTYLLQIILHLVSQEENLKT